MTVVIRLFGSLIMKSLVHVKILIEPATYNRFLHIAKDKGMKIQAYIGILIEREIDSILSKTDSDLPLNCENMKKCESVPADRNNSQNYHDNSSIPLPGQQVFNLSPLHHSEAPAIPESPYGGVRYGAHISDWNKEVR